MKRNPLHKVLHPHRFGLEHYYSDSVAIYFYILSVLMLLAHQFHFPSTGTAWFGTGAWIFALVAAGVFAKPIRPWMTQIHSWIALLSFVFLQVLSIAAYIEGDALIALVREVLAFAFGYCALLSYLTLRSFRDGTIEHEQLVLEAVLQEQASANLSPLELHQRRLVKQRLEDARKAGKLLN